MNSVRHAVSLIIGTLAVAAVHAPLAYSQEKKESADDELEEVVVTATRQSDSVNRVALSVSAQTQEALDQKGIRDIADLVATVPACA